MMDLSRLVAKPWRWQSEINDAGRHERRLLIGDMLVAIIEKMPGRAYRLHDLTTGETTDDFETSTEAKREIEFDLAERLADLAKRKLAIWK